MSISVFFAQVANATNASAGTTANPVDTAATQQPLWVSIITWLPLVALGWFLFVRPQSIAAKKQKETIGGAKTGDKVVMTNGIHGVIANVKDATFIVKVADNVKIEVEKTAVDKVTRAAAADPAPAKA